MQLPRMFVLRRIECVASPPDPKNGWAGDKSDAKMIFPGLPKDEDINNVIAHLKQFGAVGKKS
jgi:hypothetical protein